MYALSLLKKKTKNSNVYSYNLLVQTNKFYFAKNIKHNKSKLS